MAEWIFFEKSSQFDLEKSFIIKNRINWEQNVNININIICHPKLVSESYIKIFFEIDCERISGMRYNLSL